MAIMFVYAIWTPGRLLGDMLYHANLKWKLELDKDFGDRDWTQGLLHPKVVLNHLITFPNSGHQFCYV